MTKYFATKIFFPILVALVTIGIVVGIICAGIASNTLTPAQQACEHEWNVIEESNSIINIYCPKCKAEQIISKKEWNKKIVDSGYKEAQEY